MSVISLHKCEVSEGRKGTERNELQQMDASSKTRADLMLLTDLFRAANPTANTFSRRITKTGQSCSIIPFADNRTIFGTIFLPFFFKKLFWSLTFLYRARVSAKQEAENTDTRKSRAQAYLILEESWGFVGEFAPSLPLLLVASHWSLCASGADLHARTAGDVRILLYCTNSEDGGNVLFRLEQNEG